MTFSNLVCALGFTLVAACSSVGPSVNPGSTGGTSGTGGTGTCVENVLCIRGDHFDTTLCKCVPDQAGNECKTAADCKGALPALCERCASGSTACAHFECVAGACETVICPATN